MGRLRVLGFLVPVILGLLLLASSSSAAQTREGDVLVVHADGVINPVQAQFVRRAIGEAEEAGALAVIIRLDTPGGLDSSMRSIIQRMLDARVPVIVYVAPPGGRAASAGTFITMAAHVAAMAPNTTIGAAHPVAGGGEEIEGTLGEKVTNDAAAYIRSLASQHGRNAEWAERAVRESVSASAEEAVAEGIVEILAPDVPSLLREIDGMEVQLAAGPVTLETADADVRSIRMNFVERILFVVSDPEIAFILLSLGLLALTVELFNPGAIVPGVVGGISVLLALFALGTLPINWAGVALIILGFIFFVAEAVAPGVGILAAGGIIAFIFGGLILIATNNPQFQISRWLIFSLAGLLALFFTMVLGAIVRSRRKVKAVSGVEALIGQSAVARTPLEPEGMVFLGGELWSAHMEEGAAQVGDEVIVTAAQGLKLFVKPKGAEAERSEPDGSSGRGAAGHGRS